MPYVCSSGEPSTGLRQSYGLLTENFAAVVPPVFSTSCELLFGLYANPVPLRDEPQSSALGVRSACMAEPASELYDLVELLRTEQRRLAGRRTPCRQKPTSSFTQRC